MGRKLSILLFCFTLIVGAFLPQGKSIAAQGSITISADIVNVRGGPSLSYPLVKQVKKGEKYTIIKEKGDWIEIGLSLKDSGWVANWLVSKKSYEVASGNSTDQTVAISNSNQLRVRTGPGTSFPISGYLAKGQKATILDSSNENWLKISTTFGEVWVAREYVSIINSEDDSNSSVTTSNNTNTGIVNVPTLNVRKAPSTASTLLGKLSKGMTVTVNSKQNDWVEIQFRGQKAWINAQFISFQKNSSTGNTGKEPTGRIGMVTASSLSVRSSASLNSKIIGTVKKAQSFTILEENNSWEKIEFQQGRYGWVAGWYLDQSTANPPSGQTAKNSTVTILQNGTNIRKGPNVQANVLQLANKGEAFSVIQTENDWYVIKLKNGASGFVAGWMVSINGTTPGIEKPGAGSYLKNKTIVLDPGHGGVDNGTTGASGTLEKELTLRTAQLLYDKLKATGAHVYLTRSTDTYVPLPSRVSTARSFQADAFISLHYDANLDRSVRGMTGYYYHSYQKPLADYLYASTISQTRLKNRGVRFGNFHVIRENSQKAVLMELGYLSNPEEELTLTSGQFQENAATGLFNGLARYFKEK